LNAEDTKDTENDESKENDKGHLTGELGFSSQASILPPFSVSFVSSVFK
jgi:hypothetical protein